MKEVTAYQADNGTLCKTADEALHNDESVLLYLTKADD